MPTESVPEVKIEDLHKSFGGKAVLDGIMRELLPRDRPMCWA